MKDYIPVNEDLITITDYEVIEKLENPFIFKDGSPVKTKEDWQKRRKEIFDSCVELQYGKIPPAPEFLEFFLAYKSPSGSYHYTVKTGKREKPIYLSMTVFKPQGDGPFPVVVCGDRCFPYVYDKEWVSTFTDKGILLAVFNRVDLAPDNKDFYTNSPFFDTYPGDWKTTAIWAWGYSRCVDALEQIDFADTNCITFTGHSRGGKTAMLAGVLDERATIVNPNATCAGGCSCYRLKIKAITENGEIKVSEGTDIATRFPHWFNPELANYINKETELPFDSHLYKALIAPRVYLQTEAGSDIWANPVGAWQTTMAATEVYKFLGCEDKIFWHYRNGYHGQLIRDIDMLINVILHTYKGEELDEAFFRTPFKKPELMFDWRAPENN